MDKTLPARLDEAARVYAAEGDRMVSGATRATLRLAARLFREAAAALRDDEALADTQRSIIEAAERRGYERGLSELRATGEGERQEYFRRGYEAGKADATPAEPLRDAGAVEWRWVDEKRRAMTEWKASEPPPMAGVSDEKGYMQVETRRAHPAPQQPAITDAMVERACRGFYGARWNRLGDGGQASAREWMRAALTAAKEVDRG